MARRVTLAMRETLAVSRRGLRALIGRALTGQPDRYTAVFMATVLVEYPDSWREPPAGWLGTDHRGRPAVRLPPGVRAINHEIKELSLA
jgi:hypothetical protein